MMASRTLSLEKKFQKRIELFFLDRNCINIVSLQNQYTILYIMYINDHLINIWILSSSYTAHRSKSSSSLILWSNGSAFWSRYGSALARRIRTDPCYMFYPVPSIQATMVWSELCNQNHRKLLGLQVWRTAGCTLDFPIFFPMNLSRGIELIIEHHGFSPS